MYYIRHNKSKKIILGIFSIGIIFTCLSGYSFPHRNKTKVLFIGLDGATWDIMSPLVAEGKLPNIKRLIDKGSFGNLESSRPLISEVIWTSIATGKSPDKHNIKDRFAKDPETQEFVPVTSNLRNAKAIWNILSEYKKKVGIISYLCTWPPENINGIMVSDRIDPTNYSAKGYTFPPLETLCNKQEFENFSHIENSIFSRIKKDGSGYFDFVEEKKDNFVVNFSKYLLQKQDFDFFCLYIRGIDLLSHYFWKYTIPENSALPENDVERYKYIIKDYYIWCDKAIGEILNLADKDTVVIIASDHGFKTENTPNDFLIQLDRFLSSSGLNKAQKNSKVFSVVSEENGDFWWRKIRCLRIKGDLSSEEFEDVKKESKIILEDIRFKETGQQIFKATDDTKTGFFISVNMSVIKKNLKNHILIRDKEYNISDLLMPNPLSGKHDITGIIIISGKDIKQNKKITDSTIYDITPTILYIMNLPLDTGMRGKVLVAAIANSLLEKQPIKYIQTYDTPKKETEKPIRSIADEEKMKELMRSLGYIN